MDLRKQIASVAFPLFALAFAFVLEHMKKAHAFGFLPLFAVPILTAIAALVIVGVVFSALHHAEIVGEKVGEPLGTLILTLSVTFIEVAIITSTLNGGEAEPTIARAIVFSAIMIVCNGLVGASLLLGGLRHHEQRLQPLGASAYLSILIALSTLILVLPNFTETTKGPVLSVSQLTFVSISCVALYGTFLFIQTIRHRVHFIDPDIEDEKVHEQKPTTRETLYALIWLIASLLGVSLLAEFVAGGLGAMLKWFNLPGVSTIIGTILSIMLLLPEGLNALRAASRNEIQRSLNIGLGSVIATIGLTVPAVAAVSILNGRQLILGLENRDITLLMMTLAVSIVSFGSGRTNMFTGFVHIVIFANYILFLFVP